MAIVGMISTDAQHADMCIICRHQNKGIGFPQIQSGIKVQQYLGLFECGMELFHRYQRTPAGEPREGGGRWLGIFRIRRTSPAHENTYKYHGGRQDACP